jgi:hypothetical protein
MSRLYAGLYKRKSDLDSLFPFDDGSGITNADAWILLSLHYWEAEFPRAAVRWVLKDQVFIEQANSLIGNQGFIFGNRFRTSRSKGGCSGQQGVVDRITGMVGTEYWEVLVGVWGLAGDRRTQRLTARSRLGLIPGAGRKYHSSQENQETTFMHRSSSLQNALHESFPRWWAWNIPPSG